MRTREASFPRQRYSRIDFLVLFSFLQDPGTFEFILKFLRTGKLFIEPTNTLLLEELAEEAKYFQLPELFDAVQEIKTPLIYECRVVYDVCLPKFIRKGWEIVREFRLNEQEHVCQKGYSFMNGNRCKVCEGDTVPYSDERSLTAHRRFAKSHITIRRAVRASQVL
jgi:hypothetical protein